jgi:hypothetical protein
MALPTKSQIAAASKGAGDLHNTLILLTNQAATHVIQIAALQAQIAALQKTTK